MISFRYHIVSIVSVFLALAVGIALGGGPLKGEVDNSLVNELATRKAELNDAKGQVKALTVQKDYANEFATGTAGAVLGDRLAGHRVAVISLPGSDHAMTAEIGTLIEQAGGTVSGRYAIGSRLGAGANQDLVDELTDDLAKTVPDAGLNDADDTYARFGKLLARAIGSRTTGASYDGESVDIMSAMGTAGLVTTDGDPTGRADLVLVVGGGPDPSKAGQAALKVHGRIAQTLAETTDGVVVAGPTSAARGKGLLAWIRDDATVSRAVSTVDSIDTGAGRSTVVLALADRATGHIGQFGAVNAADGALPKATNSR